MDRYDYPDLYGQFGWKIGVHRAPVGYEHKWLVVTRDGTFGFWTKSEAQVFWRRIRNDWPVELALDYGCPY